MRGLQASSQAAATFGFNRSQGPLVFRRGFSWCPSKEAYLYSVGAVLKEEHQLAISDVLTMLPEL